MASTGHSWDDCFKDQILASRECLMLHFGISIRIKFRMAEERYATDSKKLNEFLSRVIKFKSDF